MNKIFIFRVFVSIIIILGIFVFFGKQTNRNVLGDASSFSSLTPTQFSKAPNSGNFTLIDVRTLDEYTAGHLRSAKQVDYYQTQQFSDYLDSLNKNSDYLIYCRTGGRSGAVLKLMQEKGFVNVYDMSGGYNAWVASGLSVER